MKGNGTTQLVQAIRKIKPPGISITTGTVTRVDPLCVNLTGSNLNLDAGDVDMLRHVEPREGDMLLLLVSADGQQYYALGVY